MGVSRQEYWNGLPFPSPGDLPDPGIEPASPAMWADSLPTELSCRWSNTLGFGQLLGRGREELVQAGRVPVEERLLSARAPCTALSGPPGKPQARTRHHSLGSPWLSILARQPCFLQPSTPSTNTPQPTLSLCAWGGPQLMFIQRVLPLLHAMRLSLKEKKNSKKNKVRNISRNICSKDQPHSYFFYF